MSFPLEMIMCLAEFAEMKRQKDRSGGRGRGWEMTGGGGRALGAKERKSKLN